MIELTCVAAFLTGFYFWLIGHWFARIVVSIILVPVCAIIGAAILNAIAVKGMGNVDVDGNVLAVVTGAVAGAWGGWLIAGAPVFYGRGWVWTERDDSEDATFNVTLRR